MKPNLNVAVAKIGKKIIFDETKWGAHGGDIDAPVYFENLFHHNPNITFWIISRNDLSDLPQEEYDRINRHGNVRDIWKGFKSFMKDDPRMRSQQWLYNKLRNMPQIDAAAIFTGPDSATNIEGKVRLQRDPTKFGRPLECMLKYVAPVYEFLNITRVPWIALVTDPRYYPQLGNDLMVPPSETISQYDTTVVHSCYIDYEDLRKEKFAIDLHYDGLEKICLIEKRNKNYIQLLVDDYFDKDINMTVVMNEAYFHSNGGTNSRYDVLKEFVLDHVDVDGGVYGKWDKEYLKDSRFKGPIQFSKLENKLKRTKYTFLIPIKEGWVTAKFWEMIKFDIIPFMHESYDDQGHLKAPEFLYVKSGKELQEKIEFLDNNPKVYQKLIKQLRDMVTYADISGKELNKTFKKKLRNII